MMRKMGVCLYLCSLASAVYAGHLTDANFSQLRIDFSRAVLLAKDTSQPVERRFDGIDRAIAIVDQLRGLRGYLSTCFKGFTFDSGRDRVTTDDIGGTTCAIHERLDTLLAALRAYKAGSFSGATAAASAREDSRVRALQHALEEALAQQAAATRENAELTKWINGIYRQLRELGGR